MKFQYCSDLHLEFQENKEFLRTNPLLPLGNVLILAGDIVPFKVLKHHDDFFDYISKNFETTYWVPGNHEYYHFDLAKKQGCFNEKIRENVFLVNNTAVQINGVKLFFLLSGLILMLRISLQYSRDCPTSMLSAMIVEC